MTRATREAQLAARPDARPFTVSRAGGPGLQRYAQTWSGDNTTSWEQLKWNFRTGLGMSISGMFNIGHDVGGFAGPPPGPELLIRWTQAGLLHPRFIMNSWKGGGVTTSPWLHLEALPAIREALRLRLRLMPYLYNAMVLAHEAHVPVLAPTFFVFEDDPATFADADAAMFGPCLLAAPALAESVREVEAYLPLGVESWRDVWTGRVYEAGQSVAIPAPLNRLPLLAPAGAIVPVTDSGDDTSRLHDEPSRALIVFPGAASGQSRVTLVEDDGLALAGPSTRVTVALCWTDDRVRVEVSASGDYPLPYSGMRVILPADETRTVELRGTDGIGLRLANKTSR